MHAIRTIGLSKTFHMGEQAVPALTNVSITVGRGEFVTVVGPSGSGKSTLLYLLGGLAPPSSGTILISGRDLTAMDDNEQSILRRREIGFVFQFFNLVPNLTAEENILVPLLLDGKKVRNYQRQLDEILAVTGLTDRRHHTPRELSGGQQQRVAIARALIAGPDIILADEPTGNLDTKTSSDILSLLQVICQEQGKTVVLVTHAPDAASYGHRTIALVDGRIADDKPRQIGQ